VATHGVFVNHVCHVVRLFPLQGVLLIRISTTPSNMSEACSLCSNVVILPSFMIYKYYEIDVDDKNYLYLKLFDYTCMLRIGCKPMILIT
jgi:hypothetical protein